KNLGHGICDIGAPHYFIQKILGTPEGEKYSIDVYTAVDMSICGILAFRSIWNGNIPVEIPNLRNLGERDAYRNDNACTNPAVAGDQILGKSPNPYPEKDTETYEFIRKLWEEGKKGVK
ncbi:MAG: hypothetical protein GX633_06685, partial [Clostridiales bacterium]|nr:hypothetical protein [Clostridiales bacterium]